MTTPVHLDWRYLGLVAIGGTAGTGTRQIIATSVPPVAGVPLVIVLINILGAFLLGALLEQLSSRDDRGRYRAVRLGAGSGFLGGFTTYSALATDTVLLAGTPAVAAAYAVGTLVLGAAATWAGMLLVIAHRRGRSRA